MRIPPLVKNYCLSICSADFNEWVAKNASTRLPFSYVWTGEYEIFEFDLGSTFNYAEMAALICPRPFMVERGHFDGVGEDPSAVPTRFNAAKLESTSATNTSKFGRALASVIWKGSPPITYFHDKVLIDSAAARSLAATSGNAQRAA
jgi:hypothetical protein